MKSVAIFAPYPINLAPSQRFRFEQNIGQLEQKGFKIKVLPFLDQSTWQALYRSHNSFRKSIGLAWCVLRQSLRLLSTLQIDIIFIHREILPIGPPILEWIIAKISRKKIIYDFDDAIWLTDNTNESWFVKKLRWRSKVASICKWSYKVSAGNEYLANFARRYSKNVIINPTTIDTELQHNPILYSRRQIMDNQIIIGWTGSHSTLKYLIQIDHILKLIEEKYSDIKYLVIADQKPKLNLKNLNFIPWNKETEIEDLMNIDIGLMPLPDDDWTRGKCGFKALQYMALEIPVLASPVGVNTQIIDHAVNGFLCGQDSDWLTHLDKLIQNKELRKEFGQKGRRKVIEHYSVLSNTANFLSLFE